MAARTPKAPNTNKTANRAGGRKPTVNRAQLKAMEARAASAARASAFARGEDVDIETAATGTATRTERGARPPRAGSRAGTRAGADRAGAYAAPDFSVRTEMEYQRRDLIRLLIVAAIVLVVFIVLTFFLR